VALVSDFNGDGRLDLFVGNDRFLDPSGQDALFMADAPVAGQAHFVDRIPTVMSDRSRDTMGAVARDVNGDGFDDLYLTSVAGNQLFFGAKDTFTSEQAAPLGVDVGMLAVADPGHAGQLIDVPGRISWAASFVDLDRDGALELFIANGAVQLGNDPLSRCQSNVYLRQGGSGLPFADITSDVGLAVPNPLDSAAPALYGRGLVVGDLDGDGDDDFLVTPYQQSYQLLRNDTPAGRHSLRVRLKGNASAPAPIGARLVVKHRDGSVTRVRLTAGGNVHSQSDDVLVVGLGDDDSLDEARVEWPSGAVQRIDTLSQFALDRTIVIHEP
jgi:hypothetical protein